MIAIIEGKRKFFDAVHLKQSFQTSLPLRVSGTKAMYGHRVFVTMQYTAHSLFTYFLEGLRSQFFSQDD